MNYRPDIDGLRTIAVVPVVFYHAGLAGFSGGFVGVDIFFVISGFLITTIIHRELLEGRFSVLRFYERRARRILPALFAVMLASLAAGWVLLTPADYDHMGQSILSALLFVSNMWFWQNSGGYFDGATDYLPMLHTWSLAVEEQFYIFFPLLLMALHRFARRLLLPAILLLVAGSLAVAVWATPRMPSASFYLLPTRIWELGIGSLLALGLVRTEAPRALRETIGALGLVGVLAPVFLYDSATVFPGLAALPPVLGAAALIWAGTAGPVLASRLLALRPMVWIGLISYSLYLWHWPIMAFVRNRFFSVELEPTWQVATILASVLAGWLSWRIVERPFRVPLRAGGMTQRRIFALSGAGMAAMGALAGAVMMTGGMATQRFSDAQLAALQADGLDSRVLECRNRTTLETLCVFGSDETTTPPSWVVWGDSHAEALLPAFDALAREHGKTILAAVMPGCAPLPAVERLEHDILMQRKCLRLKEDVERFLLEEGQVETVFLHARWPMYVEGSRYGLEENIAVTLSAPGFDVTKTSSQDLNPEIVAKTLDGLVARLTQAGLHVVIVSSVPEVPWDVREKLKGQVLYGQPFPDAPDRETIEVRQYKAEALLSEIATRHAAGFVTLTEQICDKTCPTHNGLTAYYRDTNHLTPSGARTLVLPLLEAAMAEGKS